MTKLEEMQAFTRTLPLERRQEFKSYLLGALSEVVSKEGWERAMATASQCMGWEPIPRGCTCRDDSVPYCDACVGGAR